LEPVREPLVFRMFLILGCNVVRCSSTEVFHKTPWSTSVPLGR
jgi:hypothetical protein